MSELMATEDDYRRIEARLVQAYRDMAAGDLEALLGLYRPDALIQGPAQAPVRGIAAIRAFWCARFERFFLKIEPRIEEVTALGDGWVVRGRTVGVFVPKVDGEAVVVVDSWFLQIYRRGADGTPLFWRGVNGPNL